MKNQQVNVDYWATLKAMLIYGVLTALVWLMLRLFNTVFTLPRRLRAQQENMQTSLAELQRRFPDLNITEEDLKNAEQELEALARGDDAASGDDHDSDGAAEKTADEAGDTQSNMEIKKTI